MGRIPKVPDMATSPASQTNGMESGGAAPFHDIFTKTSDATETEKLPESFSILLGIKERPGKIEKYQLKRHKRIKRAKCYGSVLAYPCGMFVVAAGAVALWEGGVTLFVLGSGLLLFGIGRLLTARASFAECRIEIQRKGVLQTEWKTFFQRIVAAIFRELPEESSQIKGKLRKVAVDLNHQQKNVEICNLTGSVIATIGGIIAAVAAVAAGQTYGVALPVVAAAMIVCEVGALVFATASIAQLRSKASLADGIVQICNFTEMERLHELTAKKEDIGINVLCLHKHYKDARRTELAGSAFEFIAGFVIVVSGAVAIWTRGLGTILFGAGLIVFGAAVALAAGASFSAGIFGRRKKVQLLKDWKVWRKLIYQMEMTKLRDVEQKSQDLARKLEEVASELDRLKSACETAEKVKMAEKVEESKSLLEDRVKKAMLNDMEQKSRDMVSKLEEAAKKIDSWKGTCDKVKTAGKGFSFLGSVVAVAGVVGTVVTGGALPLAAAAAVGAMAYKAGEVLSSGADVAQNTVEQTFLECLLEEWNGLSKILSREMEVLRSKAKDLNSELETNLTDAFQSIASTVFNIKAVLTGENSGEVTSHKDTDKPTTSAGLREVVASQVSQISIDFRNFVKSMAEISYDRKSQFAMMLRRLARDLQILSPLMIRVNEELYSRTLKKLNIVQ
ncbi:uncharacterized protein LOC112567205 isoform X1 [Pomacea canaliculata]|uniref:uncharacterized protein LOC112567205 isoform X1 n=2 Tax=Pomacea canaliculata TaxID=400727 RepID=UPI000D72F5F9|nr:uncharacterized protein LOC112567205 isoform X1 [Pomacea canaliculata]